MDSNKRYDCYCPDLGTTKLPLFMQYLPWSPHVCMEFMESDLQPSVDKQALISLPLLILFRLKTPHALCSDLCHPVIFAAVVTCLPKHIPAFDLGLFQKTSA